MTQGAAQLLDMQQRPTPDLGRKIFLKSEPIASLIASLAPSFMQDMQTFMKLEGDWLASRGMRMLPHILLVKATKCVQGKYSHNEYYSFELGVLKLNTKY